MNQPTRYELWLTAKETERNAVDARREIEDELLKEWGNPTEEGVKSFEDGGCKIKVTFRYNRTIDAKKMQEIAIEKGLEHHLSALVRWKAELVKKEWDKASSDITTPLMEAVTTKPGRPSFAIEKIEEK